MQVSGFTRAPILWFHASSKPLVSLSLWQSQSSTTVMYSFTQAPFLWFHASLNSLASHELQSSCFTQAQTIRLEEWRKINNRIGTVEEDQITGLELWRKLLFDLPPLLQSCYLIFLHSSNPIVWSSSKVPILLFDLPPQFQSYCLISSTAPIMLFHLHPLLQSCYLIFLHCSNPVIWSSSTALILLFDLPPLHQSSPR